MTGQSRGNALDHVIVVVFENRSLDNVLGRLYGPGDGKTFEGVLGKDLTNPIPEWAEHGADRKVVPYAVATDMDTGFTPEQIPVLSGLARGFGVFDHWFCKTLSAWAGPCPPSAKPPSTGSMPTPSRTTSRSRDCPPTHRRRSPQRRPCTSSTTSSQSSSPCCIPPIRAWHRDLTPM